MSKQLVETSNTSAFYAMAWLAFGVSSIGMVAGVLLSGWDFALKGFLLMTYLFSVTSCFTVAKVVRDRQESQRLTYQVQRAKTEQLISKYVTEED